MGIICNLYPCLGNMVLYVFFTYVWVIYDVLHKGIGILKMIKSFLDPIINKSLGVLSRLTSLLCYIILFILHISYVQALLRPKL